jgi:hypothetical protein
MHAAFLWSLGCREAGLLVEAMLRGTTQHETQVQHATSRLMTPEEVQGALGKLLHDRWGALLDARHPLHRIGGAVWGRGVCARRRADSAELGALAS